MCLQHPLEQMKFWINRTVFVEEHLVEWHGEPIIYVVPMENCHSYHLTHKMKIGQMILK